MNIEDIIEKKYNNNLPLTIEEAEYVLTNEGNHIFYDGTLLKMAYKTLLTAYEKEKEKNKVAIDFTKQNSHEFYCKRDDLMELEFDDNTNATDLIDILEGNW